MFNPDRSLQDPVRVIAIFLGCITILVGVSIIVHDGDLELSVVGSAINIFTSGVLFLGAKRRSSTHLVVWLMFALLQIVGLVIGMCYFAYQANSLRISDNSSLEPTGSIGEENIENNNKFRISYIVYSIGFGILAALFIFISAVVKKFYDELRKQRPYGRNGR